MSALPGRILASTTVRLELDSSSASLQEVVATQSAQVESHGCRLLCPRISLNLPYDRHLLIAICKRVFIHRMYTVQNVSGGTFEVQILFLQHAAMENGGGCSCPRVRGFLGYNYSAYLAFNLHVPGALDAPRQGAQAFSVCIVAGYFCPKYDRP